jgi:hypothetical protein
MLKPFEDVKDTKQVIEFFSNIANSIREGQDISNLNDDFSKSFWPTTSWIKVGIGHNNETLRRNASFALEKSSISKQILNNHKEIKVNQNTIVSALSSHRDFMHDLLEGEGAR